MGCLQEYVNTNVNMRKSTQ